MSNYFCVPQSCKVYTSEGVCTVCIEPKILRNDGLACSCPLTFYDTTSGGCDLCSAAIDGCINCLSNSTCLSCDTLSGYALVSTSSGILCRRQTASTNFVTSQSWQGMQIQVRLNQQESVHDIIKSVNVTLYTVYGNLTGEISPSYLELEVINSKFVEKSTLVVLVANPVNHLNNQLVHLKYSLMRYTSRSLG